VPTVVKLVATSADADAATMVTPEKTRATTATPLARKRARELKVGYILMTSAEAEGDPVGSP
jgi:hypothetical protein